MKPTVGRIVHYVSYGTPGGEYTKECRAAIVTAPTSDYEISLCVLNPTGLFFNQGVEHDPGAEQPIERPNGEIVHINTYRGGTWHWPERED